MAWRNGAGHEFRVVDTGGIVPDDKEFHSFRRSFVRRGWRSMRLLPSSWSWMRELGSQRPDRGAGAAFCLRTWENRFSSAANKVDSGKQDGMTRGFSSARNSGCVSCVGGERSGAG